MQGPPKKDVDFKMLKDDAALLKLQGDHMNSYHQYISYHNVKVEKCPGNKA